MQQPEETQQRWPHAALRLQAAQGLQRSMPCLRLQDSTWWHTSTSTLEFLSSHGARFQYVLLFELNALFLACFDMLNA